MSDEGGVSMEKLPLISFKRYFDQLDDSDILTFSAFSREQQEKLLKMLLPSYLDIELERAYRKSQKVLFKPEGVQLSHKYNKIYFSTKSGTIATDMTDDLLDFIAEAQNQQLYIKAALVKKVPVGNTRAIYFAEIDAIYTATYDYDTAKELLKDYMPYELLLYSVGYVPSAESLASKLPMFLPIFKPNNQPIHVLTFTPPRYGKSKTASILRGLTESYHTVLPSPAKLIYDGRSGRYGLCYFYNTLYIDEFDKIAGRRKDIFKESYEVLLTGMSDGLWLRDISSKAQDYNNIVAFCFLGNVENSDLRVTTQDSFSMNHRDKLRELIYAADVEASPFIERIAYAEFVYKGVQAYKWLNFDEENRVLYLEPKVARAVIKLLNDECKKQGIQKKPESEMDKHLNNLNAVLNTLKIDIDLGTLEELVSGRLIFSEILTDLPDESDEAIKQVEHDKELTDEVLREVSERWM